MCIYIYILLIDMHIHVRHVRVRNYQLAPGSNIDRVHAAFQFEHVTFVPSQPWKWHMPFSKVSRTPTSEQW